MEKKVIDLIAGDRIEGENGRPKKIIFISEPKFNSQIVWVQFESGNWQNMHMDNTVTVIEN